MASLTRAVITKGPRIELGTYSYLTNAIILSLVSSNSGGQKLAPLRNGLAGRGIYIPLFHATHFGSGGTPRPAAKMTAHKTVLRSL